MTHLVWLTDIHVSFLVARGAFVFGQEVRKEHPDMDCAVVTGDIGEFPNFLQLIEEFAEGACTNVHFVCGNHDAYGGSVGKMRGKASQHVGKAKYLPTAGVVKLTPEVVLVGADGWWDARNGDAQKSNVVMSDWVCIQEFRGTWGNGVIATAQEIADEEAEKAKVMLSKAVQSGAKRIIFATHVPPYANAAWHQGQQSDSNWLPWMSNKVMGEVLDEVANANPDIEFTVLCGHTHGKGTYRRSLNLTVLTGDSEYYLPRVCGTFDL